MLKDRLKKAMAGPPKVSQVALARACGASAPTVHAWLTGETKTIKSPMLVAAARFLNVSADWLVTGRGQMRPTPIQREQGVTGSVNSPSGSQSLRMDRARIHDAIALLSELAELQGIPALPSDPEAIAIAYDFLAEFESPVESSNILDMTKRLAAKLRGNGSNGDGAANTG